MKLHRDKFSFLNIIGIIHGVTEELFMMLPGQGRYYVFSEKDLLPFEFVTSQLKKLQEILIDMEKKSGLLHNEK